MLFPANDFKQPAGFPPDFFTYPIQSDRPGWLPLWTPTILPVPQVRDANGNRIPWYEIWDVAF